jgi:hypothetical protein
MMKKVRRSVLLSQGRAGAERREGSDTIIRVAVRFKDGMVMTFDSRGNQVPGYYGCYEDVRENILKAAPQDAVFAYSFTDSRGMKRVPRGEW